MTMILRDLNHVVLTGIYNEQIAPPTFFLSKFWKTQPIAIGDYLVGEFYRGSNAMAPMRPAEQSAPFLARQQRDLLDLATIYESKICTPLPIATLAKERPFGEPLSIPLGGTQQTAMMETIKRQLEFHKQHHVRRWEWMCCGQTVSAFHGMVDYNPGAPVEQFRVNFTNAAGTAFAAGTHDITLAAGNLWSAATGVPIANLRTWISLILRDSGYQPTDLVMGEGASQAFLDNVEVRALLNLWNYKPGNFDLTNLTADNGAQFEGRILGLNVWTVFGQYTSDAGVATPYMPTDHVAVIASGAPLDMHPCAMYGVDQTSGNIIESKDDVYVTIEVQQNQGAPTINLVSRSKRLPWPKVIWSWVMASVI